MKCEDCHRPTTHSSRGLCSACYQRHRRAGTLDRYTPTRKPRTRKPCTKCGHPQYARGLCRNHYNKTLRRHTAYGTWTSTLTPAAPIAAHIHALRAAGLSNSTIAERTGLSTATIQRSTKQKSCHQATADAILAIHIPTDIVREAAGGRMIDATGTQRRIQALVATGYTYRALGEHLGIRHSSVWRILEETQVQAKTARNVLDVYNRLSMTPGGSQRAISRATRRGWAPPLAWDDDTIDNPDATPDTGTTTRRGDSDIDERLDELERLVSYGERPIDAMRRVGWANWNSVNVAYRRTHDSTPPWCKNGHPRLDRTDPAFCPDCLATHYEKKAAS